MMRGMVLSPQHIQFIIYQHFILCKSVTEVYNIITNPEACVEHRISAIPTLSRMYFWKRVARIKDEEIDAARRSYETEMYKELFASKHTRVAELCKMVKAETNPEIKRKLLKDIKEEVGEDKMFDAIAKSGRQIVKINLTDELAQFLSGESTDENDSETEEDS